MHFADDVFDLARFCSPEVLTQFILRIHLLQYIRLLSQIHHHNVTYFINFKINDSCHFEHFFVSLKIIFKMSHNLVVRVRYLYTLIVLRIITSLLDFVIDDNIFAYSIICFRKFFFEQFTVFDCYDLSARLIF